MSLEPSDFEEIRQLLARYNFAVDLGDVDSWVNTFTLVASVFRTVLRSEEHIKAKMPCVLTPKNTSPLIKVVPAIGIGTFSSKETVMPRLCSAI